MAIYPKKQQKINLISEYKQKVSSGAFKDKYERKFGKLTLSKQIKALEDIMVFVEVKARFSKKFGYPYESVDKHKQHNLIRGCKAYLNLKSSKQMQTRIDVISVVDDEIVHIENVFEDEN